MPKGENDRTCRRLMAAASPAISMAASITAESLNGAVLNTILLACQQHALVFSLVFFFCLGPPDYALTISKTAIITILR